MSEGKVFALAVVLFLIGIGAITLMVMAAIEVIT